MPSIRARPDNGLLFFDFRFKGQRCRELTLLENTPANQKKLQRVMDRIEAEIRAGTFVYANYFPNSKALHRFAKEEALDESASATPSTVTGEAETAAPVQSTQAVAGPVAAPDTSPLFRDFANEIITHLALNCSRCVFVSGGFLAERSSAAEIFDVETCRKIGARNDDNLRVDL